MKQTLEEILQGKNVQIPMYDFRSHSRYVHVVEEGGGEGGKEEGREGGREGGREVVGGREGRRREKGRKEGGKRAHTLARKKGERQSGREG